MADNPLISKIEVDGDLYDIKDEYARNMLADMEDLSDSSFVAALIDLLYPVGSTKLTLNSSAPFDYGTWEKIGAGCAIVGVDPNSSVTVFKKAYGVDGNVTPFGFADATLPSHTHTISKHSHTVNSHTHGPGTLTGRYHGRDLDDKKKPGVHGAVSYQYTNFNVWSTDGSVKLTSGATGASSPGTSATALTPSTVGSSPTNKNYPPSIPVYIWRRTA